MADFDAELFSLHRKLRELDSVLLPSGVTIACPSKYCNCCYCDPMDSGVDTNQTGDQHDERGGPHDNRNDGMELVDADHHDRHDPSDPQAADDEANKKSKYNCVKCPFSSFYPGELVAGVAFIDHVLFFMLSFIALLMEVH